MSNQNGTNLGELTFTGQPWTDIRFNGSIIMDAVIKLFLGFSAFQMTELGESLEAISKIGDSDEEQWINSWADMGARLQARAEKAEKEGRRVSASQCYLRAATYYCIGVICFSVPEDPRVREYSLIYKKLYAKFLELSGYPGEVVKIPYEDTFLPGYFFKSPAAKEKAPLLVITPGRDTFCEDTVWIFTAAMRRGMHCLIFDGPGQGAALRINNIYFRPDWENVVGQVIDYGLTFPGVDPERIGLVGMSMGGLLTVRAAAFEKRAKIAVADPGNSSWGAMVTGLLQRFVDVPLETLPAQFQSMVTDYAWKHNIPKTIKGVIEVINDYDYTSVVGNITCKTLVVDGSAELIPDAAKNLYDLLKCPKDYLLFDEKTTGQLHCQIGAPLTAGEYVLDWITANL